jgi:anti-sigma B factor antagonist
MTPPSSLCLANSIWNADQLRARLSDVIMTNPVRVVIDLTDVPFVDSTILGVLVGARNELGRSGGRFQIICSNPAVLSPFR